MNLQGLTTGFVAGGEIKMGRFVYISGSHQVSQCDASVAGVSDKPIGVSALQSQKAPLPNSLGLQNAADAAGDQLAVVGGDGVIVEIEAAAAIAAGDYLVPDAAGRAVPVVLPSAGTRVFARAVEPTATPFVANTQFVKAIFLDTQLD